MDLGSPGVPGKGNCGLHAYSQTQKYRAEGSLLGQREEHKGTIKLEGVLAASGERRQARGVYLSPSDHCHQVSWFQGKGGLRSHFAADILVPFISRPFHPSTFT